MRELNDDWRDLRQSTDVLSFPGELLVQRVSMYCVFSMHCVLTPVFTS